LIVFNELNNGNKFFILHFQRCKITKIINSKQAFYEFIYDLFQISTKSNSTTLRRWRRALDLGRLLPQGRKNTAISWIKLFFDLDCSILPKMPSCHHCAAARHCGSAALGKSMSRQP
jgi:hypothetical protein